jgi:hypothetical protein
MDVSIESSSKLRFLLLGVTISFRTDHQPLSGLILLRATSSAGSMRRMACSSCTCSYTLPACSVCRRAVSLHLHVRDGLQHLHRSRHPASIPPSVPATPAPAASNSPPPTPIPHPGKNPTTTVGTGAISPFQFELRTSLCRQAALLLPRETSILPHCRQHGRSFSGCWPQSAALLA